MVCIEKGASSPLLSILILFISTLIPVLSQSNRVYTTFQLTFSTPFSNLANTYTALILDFTTDLGITLFTISTIQYQAVGVCSAITVTPASYTLSGTTLTIQTPYPSSQFDTNGRYNSGACPVQSYQQTTVFINCAISTTYGGTLSYSAYSYKSPSRTASIGTQSLTITPDYITDAMTSFGFAASTASKQILQTGTYTLTMTTPTPAATVSQMVVTLPNTWIPDTVVDDNCATTMPKTSPASFSSTKLGTLTTVSSVTTSNNVNLTFSFTALSLNAATVDLTFTMTNPYSTQNIILEGNLVVQVVFYSSTGLIPFQTSLTASSINASALSYTNCNQKSAAQILCSSTSSGTYSSANCVVGSTMYVQLLLMPMLFQDVYSSVQFTVSNLPLQSSISGITMNVQNFSPSLVATTVSSTQSTTTHTIYFSQYLTGTSTYSSFPFICQYTAVYLQVNIPNMQLPYDINGLNIAANFYVQPFLSAASYTTYGRVTSTSSTLQNASCGTTQLTVNQNYLSSAAVTTSTTANLQVGATAATHTIKILSSYSFLSTAGKIVLTLPSILTMNTGTFSCTCSFVLPSTTLLSITVSSCTFTGSPVVVTLAYTYSGSQLAQGFQITINQVINPIIITYSGEFSVATYLLNSALSETNNSATTGFGFTTVPAPFTTATMVNQGTGTKTVYVLSPYLMTLVSPVSFTNGNKISITFPSFISEINTITVTAPSSGISVTTGTNVVPLVLSFTSTVAAGTPITLTFYVRNPPVSNKDYSYVVQALTSSNVVVLQSTITYGSADSITKTTFSQFAVSSNSPQNLLSTAVYTVSFTSNVLLASPSTLILTYTAPTTTFNFFTTGTTTCSAVTTGLTLSCTLNSPATNQITVTFSSTISPATNYQLLVSNAYNYMSLSPFTITGDLGYSLTQLGNESTYTITNTSILTLSTATISLSDTFLGDQSTYSFTLTGITPSPTTGGIYITTTNLVTFTPASTTVTINSSLCTGTITSTTIDLPCFPAQDPTTIVITAVNNPTKLVQTTTTPFTINLYETASLTEYTIKQFTNSNLVYTNACSITNYCKTCLTTNTSNCQSCYSASTITYSASSSYVAEVILNQATTVQKCVASCSTGTYQTTSAGMQVCLACNSNCSACSTSATFCTACSGSLYLNPLTNTCVSTCPTNYYAGTSNTCLLCSLVGNCLTCSSAGVCLSCDTTTYKLQNTSCVTACDTGYYQTSGGTVCTACPTGCSACTSSTNCTSCTSTYISYLTTCVTSCPTGYSKLLNSTTNLYYCGLCDSSCLTCDTLSTTCTSCYANTYLYLSKCIIQSAIPSGYYGDNTTWTALQCMSYCTQCSYKSLCTTCATGTVIYQGVCYTSCPSEAPTSDGAGGCKTQYVPTSVSSNTSKIIPFPMLLSCVAFCISVYFSKYEKPQTFVPGCIVGFCAIFEWVSWIILIAITYLNDGIMNITTVAAVLGFVLVYLFNLLSLIYYKKVIAPDSNFMEWGLNHKNRICKNTCVILACVFSFKIQKIIFCKYFNQNFFKAKLKDIDIFSPFNKITIFSVIFNSFLIILSAAIFSYRYQSSTQIFILSLDTLLVTMFMIIFMIWEAFKNEHFFEETYNFNFEQMSQYTQRFFPFDQSYMERAKQRSVYGHLRKSDSNSSLMEFGRDNKVSKVEPLQQPLNDVMDPNDISTNAALDKNVLNNSVNGAPYVIQDELLESSKPGKKRQFQKNHIAPIFDHNNFPPIEENSLEDDEDYYDDVDQNQTMKQMYRKQSSRAREDQEVGAMNQSHSRNYDSKIISLDEKEDIEHQKSHRLKNNKDSAYNNSNGFNRNQDGNEPVPGRQNQNHTIYYDPHDPTGQMKNVSMGVGVQEEDEEGEEFRQRLFSKQDGSDNIVDKAALVAGAAAASKGVTIDKNGNQIDEEGNIIDKNGNKIDKNGNIIDKEGNIIDKDGNKTDKNGNRFDKDGNKIDKNGNKIDKDGNIIDKEGNIIDKDGNKTDKNGNRFDKNGNRIDKEGNLIDKDGNKIDKDGNKIDKNGNKIDKNGNIIDKEGNVIDKDGNKTDKNGNRFDKNGNKIDKNGNIIDKDGNIIDKEGNIIDKNGNKTDKNGNRFDKDGNRIDKDGNRIDKDGHRVNKDGHRIDKDGNLVDKDGHLVDKDGNKIDKKGNKIDKNGNIIDKDGNIIDKDGNKTDKNGNRFDKDGNKIDKDGNKIDKNGNIIDKEGNVIDKNGNKTDKNGNRFDKNGNRIDKDGNLIDKDGHRIDKDGNKIDKDGKKIDNKNKNPNDDMLFYFNNPIEENEKSKNNQNKQDTKVEKIMPDVEDLDDDPTNKEKNQKEKNIKMITPNDRKGGDLNKKAPQKNNLFGTSDDEDANEGGRSNKKGKSDAKNNIYDSEESLHTASEAEVNFNEVSPSDFNILNQRYEEDYFVQPPQSALQMQMLQQSLSQLNRNYSQSQSSANMIGSGANPHQSQTHSGQYSTGVGVGQGGDNKNFSQSGQHNLTGPNRGLQSSQRQHQLQQSNSNASFNSANPSNIRKQSNSPVKKQKQLGLNNSRSQNANALSVDVRQNTMGNSQAQSNNLSSINSNNNNQNYNNRNGNNPQPILPNGDLQNQLVIENFDDFNNTSSQSGFQQGGNGQNQFYNSFNNQDPRMSYTQMNRGNMSSRSKGNSPSNSNITYKVPAVDVNKLKNLEKIYLQRIEANAASQQSSRKNNLKKKKKKIQRELSQNSGLQVHGNQGMKSPGDMSEVYFGERGQKFDPSMLDNNGEEVIDFDDDDDQMGPENVNFDQNF